MQDSVVVMIELLAAVGLFSGAGWIINRGVNARKEIRKALVLFDDGVRPVARGDWPGFVSAGMTPEQQQNVRVAWGEKRSAVAEHRKKVEDLIATDRRFPGPWWCTRVENLLELGYGLVHHVIGMKTLPDIDHQKWNLEYLEKRAVYEEAYRRLTGKRKSTR